MITCLNYSSYVVLLLLVGLIGCSPKGMRQPSAFPEICYYDQKDDCRGVYRQYDKDSGYRLAFVEIDDQGHFYDRRQVDNVLHFIREGGKNQRILIYVHGWHHNAGYDDQNLENFRKLLAHSSKFGDRETVGIYIGWRGESVELDLINWLTFWDRKNVSEEVGQGALVEFLARAEQLSNETESHLITIGHSFGASVVWSSIKSLVTERLAKQKWEDDPDPVGFGNLVVLVNPAIEAMHYATFRDLTEEKERKGELEFSGEKPRIIIATSETDRATDWLFPLGRKVSTFFEFHRDIERKNRHGYTEEFSQDTMDEHSVGHFEGFITHHLEAEGKIELNLDTCEEVTSKMLVAKEKKTEGWKDKLHFGVENKHLMTLRHMENSSAYNPYWVVQVDNAIIPDHNDILTGGFVCFIRKYL